MSLPASVSKCFGLNRSLQCVGIIWGLDDAKGCYLVIIKLTTGVAFLPSKWLVSIQPTTPTRFVFFFYFICTWERGGATKKGNKFISTITIFTFKVRFAFATVLDNNLMGEMWKPPFFCSIHPFDITTLLDYYPRKLQGTVCKEENFTDGYFTRKDLRI